MTHPNKAWVTDITTEVRLYANYPNPFNPSTTIHFDLPQRAPCRLAVYDAAGREVQVLEDGIRDAGQYEVTWRGTDKGGRHVASGVYFCRLDAGGRRFVKRLVLLR